MNIKKMPSSSAQDRSIAVWFQKLNNGEIKLPRFQRHQAWDKGRICSLLNTVIQNLPLGVTLILDVDKEQFVSRYLVTAPEIDKRVTEHLLDGQQRLTSLWRSLYNNYKWSKYFVYLGKYDRYHSKVNKEFVDIHYQTRWLNKKDKLMPLWADSPKHTFQRGLIPMNLFRPGDIADEYEQWVNQAMQQFKPEIGNDDYENKLMDWMMEKNKLRDDIRDIRETITHFNLPFLSLPTTTSKETALQVFINMNTNSKPLSQYDIIRAEIEGVAGKSLDDLEEHLRQEHSKVEYYERISYLILATSALLQDKLPNQRGMWDMHKEVMVNNWGIMETGLGKMAEFMEEQGILDRQRLPTNAVLSVIASLYKYEPKNVDEKGIFNRLLKKYLWTSFFTDRYENSAATHAYNDFIALKKIITKSIKENGQSFTINDVPVFGKEKYPLADIDELIKVGWPKRESIRARAIMAVFYKLGAFDFADGSRLNRTQLANGKRHYHHVFPDSLIKELEDLEPSLALNCALISDGTNLNISNKEPLRYLKERYHWMDEDIVNTRLKSHLIPIAELANGGYEHLSVEDKNKKLKADYLKFIKKRAAYVVAAIEDLTEGKEIAANQIISRVENNDI